MTPTDLNQSSIQVVSALPPTTQALESTNTMNNVEITSEVTETPVATRQSAKQVILELRDTIAKQQALILLASETLFKLHLKNASLEEQLAAVGLAKPGVVKENISTDEEAEFVDVNAPLLMSFSVGDDDASDSEANK
jgi:hypothetical protein